jgi:hypothetical protein
MATIYTTRTLEPVQGGVRQPASHDSYLVPTLKGVRVDSQNNSFDPITGYRTPILIGTRSRVVNGYEATTYQGSIVDINTVDAERHYAMLQQQGTGKRNTWFTSDNMMFAPTVKASRVSPALVGVGAFGIHYTQTIIVQDDKRIRRWPRDWHGENMN